jgi:replicative DNA helicase
VNIDKTTSNTDFIESVEDKLISIFLNDNDSAVEGNVFLIPKNFSKKENAIIFGAMKELIENSKSVDETTVLAILNAHDDRQFPNYKTYILKLISTFTSASNVTEYIEIVKNASVKRELDKICGEIIDEKFDFSSFDKEITKRIKEFNEVA